MKRGETGKRASARRGSVLMEYVVLTSVVLLTLMGSSSLFVDLDGAPMAANSSENWAIFSSVDALDYDQAAINAGDKRYDFGILGNEFVDWYRRLVTGIALPFP